MPRAGFVFGLGLALMLAALLPIAAVIVNVTIEAPGWLMAARVGLAGCAVWLVGIVLMVVEDGGL